MQIHNEGPRLSWYLAVIEELIIGNDGLVRAAIIRTSTGHTNRPIVKLYPLEVTSAETTVISHSQRVDRNTEEEGSALTLEKRPLRTAAGRVKCQMSEWIQAIRAPQRMSEIPLTVNN